MKKHIFIIVRFSVLSEDGSAWKLGRGDFENYKKSLFDSERLAHREKIFREITLPSLLNQKLAPTKENITLLVITANALPSSNLKSLERLLSPYPWAKIVQFPSNKPFAYFLKLTLRRELEEFNDTVCYGTTRLDDDDALSHSFLEEVYKYLDPNFLDYCISFGRGYAGVFNHKIGGFESFHDYYYPKIAIGLSHINIYDPKTNTFGSEKLSIFHKGNHLKVDLNSPTIIDSTKPIFLRTIHSFSDTINDQQLKMVREKPSVEPEIVKKLFNLDEKLVIDTKSKYVELDKKLSQIQTKLQYENERQEQLKSSLKKIDDDLKKLKDRTKIILEKRNYMKSNYKKIQQSRSWRYTALLRKVSLSTKKIFKED